MKGIKNDGDDMDDERIAQYWKDFCGKRQGVSSNKYYERKEVGHDSFKHLISADGMNTIWRDFAVFRHTFIENELKHFLIKLSLSINKDKNSNKRNETGAVNGDDMDIDHFYSYFDYYRNGCGILPTNYYFFSNLSKYKPLTSCLINTSKNRLDYQWKKFENLSPLLIYFLIFNCIFILFHSTNNCYPFGFDNFIFEKTKIEEQEKEKEKEKEETAQDKKDKKKERKKHRELNCDELCQLCGDYLLNQMTQTGIFGDYVNEGAFHSAREQTAKEAEMKKRDECIELCKKLVFGNDISILNDLCKYCIQDITDINAYINNGGEYGDSGLSCFIIHRLAFFIFNQLINMENDDSNIDSNVFNQQDKNEQSRALQRFYKFFWNFSIYFHCMPHDWWDQAQKTSEPFYLSQYLQFRDKWYENIFGNDNTNNNNNNNGKCKTDRSSLSQYNYLCTGSIHGTLLHGTCHCNMRHYSHVLINDGFDIRKYNRKKRDYLKRCVQPFEIAQKNNFNSILSQMKALEQNSVGMESSVTANAVEMAYQEFSTQLMFSKYFLMILGCNVLDQELNVPRRHYHSPAVTKDDYKGHFSDQFYRNYSQYHGLRKKLCVFGDTSNKSGNTNGNTSGTEAEKLTTSESKEQANELMNNVLLGVLRLLKHKIVAKDDFLVLCFEYCKIIDDTSNGKTRLADEFVQTLQGVAQECLSSDDTIMKQRNYLWFKAILMNSNIWYARYFDRDDTKNNKSKGEVTVLYKFIDQTVEQELIGQKNYIWDSIGKEEKQDVDGWNKLLTFTFEDIEKQDESKLRQDGVEHGIKSLKSQNELYIIGATMDVFDKQENNRFNIQNEMNTKVYLTRCLLFAHANNGKFQAAMKSIFEDTGEKHKLYNLSKWSKSNDNDNGVVSFTSAPVKQHERCNVKCGTDYADRAFPSSSCILDFMRCSVVYKNGESLYDGVCQFIDKINKGEIDCLTKIVRMKNGFADIKNWKSFVDAHYCDLKINVIYRNREENCSMIVEIQFLLSFLLTAKKMGHKLYVGKNLCKHSLCCSL